MYEPIYKSINSRPTTIEIIAQAIARVSRVMNVL